MAAHQDRACATKPHSAPELGALEVQYVAQRPQQRHFRRHIQRGDYIVDCQFKRHVLAPVSTGGRGSRGRD